MPRELKGKSKMTRLCRSKRIAQIQEQIKKSNKENTNFPIHGKLKPLYEGKLILKRHK